MPLSLVNATRLLATQPRLAASLTPRWNKYIPHSPTPKQRIFLLLHQEEAFYGGALGGGKSDALLAAALQYVDIPGYSAILFRRTFADLSLTGSLMDRAHAWLHDTDARWNGSKHFWTFPSGARLSFGYLDSEKDKHRYAGSEYHFIGFDEVTQLQQNAVDLVCTRLRRTEIIKKAGVPLRIRMASNPGNVGHRWVKDRFKIQKDPVTGKYRGFDPNRPYIPAYLTDNPYLDSTPYLKSLKARLDPVTLAQLLAGDWGVSADGRFSLGWKQTFEVVGKDSYIPEEPWRCRNAYIQLGNPVRKSFHLSQCRRFITVDTATSTKDGPNASTSKTSEPNWTVVSTWLLTPHFDLVLWHVERFQLEIPEAVQRTILLSRLFDPESTNVESNGTNTGFYQVCKRSGLNVRPLNPGVQDKIARSVHFANRMHDGRVYFPAIGCNWLSTAEEELYTWTGTSGELDDFIDTCSYAGIYANNAAMQSPGYEQSQYNPQYTPPQFTHVPADFGLMRDLNS